MTKFQRAYAVGFLALVVSSAVLVASAPADDALTPYYSNRQIQKIFQASAKPSAPADGNVWKYSASDGAMEWGSASGAPSGSAGGDLGGTYPNPTVTGLTHATTNLVFTPNSKTITWGSNNTLGFDGLSTLNWNGSDANHWYGMDAGSYSTTHDGDIAPSGIFSANGGHYTYELGLGSSWTLAFLPSQFTNATPDASITRIGSGVLGVGTGAHSSVDGQIQCASTTASATLAPTWTNFPGANIGAQNPYTWVKMVAQDGTQVYVPAFR